MEFRLPPLSADMDYATVAQWLKQEGDRIVREEPILEIDADKVTHELAAPASGTLAEILALEGDEIRVGAVLAVIEEDGS